MIGSCNMDDINIRYLKDYYERYGTINNIPTTTEVEFEGQILKIGSFLGTMRNRYKIHREGKGRPGELALWRYKQLNDMRFEWTPRDTQANHVKSKDPYIKYLRRHYNLYGTINDITKDMNVEFEGKFLRIGNFLSATRIKHRHYLNGDDTPGCSSSTALERYKILEQMKIEWDPREKSLREKLETTDKHMRYLREHYETYGTINNISTRAIVLFENEPLKIGNFLDDIRSSHRNYVAVGKALESCGEYSLSRYRALDEMNFDWNPSTYKPSFQSEKDIYMRYLQQFYFEHGNLDDVILQDLVEFEGQILRIRSFISDIRKKHLNYEMGINKRGSCSKAMIKKYQILEALGFNWNNEKDEITRLALLHNIPQGALYDYLNQFSGDLQKALAFCVRHKKFEEDNASLRLSKYNLSLILKNFNMNTDMFFHYLNKDGLRTYQTSREIIYDDDMSLEQFCMINGLNFEIIGKVIRIKLNGLCEESLDSLLEKAIINYQKNGQLKLATLMQDKGDNEPLVSHMLTAIGADSMRVLRDMSWYVISMEDALLRESFRKVTCGKCDYLQGILQDYVLFYHRVVASQEEYDEEAVDDVLNLRMEQLVDDYHLLDEEINVLKDVFNDYTTMIYRYHLFQVGFEREPEKCIQRIIDYHFDEDDVEEAFFMPIKFEKSILLNHNSKLYKRRSLLKNLTVSWNDLTLEERSNKIRSFDLTMEELSYISAKREQIDDVKEKVLLKKSNLKGYR